MLGFDKAWKKVWGYQIGAGPLALVPGRGQVANRNLGNKRGVLARKTRTGFAGSTRSIGGGGGAGRLVLFNAFLRDKSLKGFERDAGHGMLRGGW